MSTQTKYPKINILGVEVDKLTRRQAIELIVKRCQQTRAVYAVKPYVEFVERAHINPDIKQLLNNAYLSLADGVALQWGAAYLARPKSGFIYLVQSLAEIIFNPKSLRKILPERAAGITFTAELLRACANKKLKVFLIGSPQRGSIAQTAQSLRQQFRNLQITGSFALERHGKQVSLSMGLERQLLKQLQAEKPDIILVGFGFPRQEQLMARLSRQLNHGVLIGEGGSFDYQEFGGHIRRAPTFIRRSGLEWVWRLLRQPSRFGRQLAIPRYIWRIYHAKIIKKLPSHN